MVHTVLAEQKQIHENNFSFVLFVLTGFCSLTFYSDYVQIHNNGTTFSLRSENEIPGLDLGLFLQMKNININWSEQKERTNLFVPSSYECSNKRIHTISVGLFCYYYITAMAGYNWILLYEHTGFYERKLDKEQFLNCHIAYDYCASRRKQANKSFFLLFRAFRKRQSINMHGHLV